MPISQESYAKIARHLTEVCNQKELTAILDGDFTAIRRLIAEELLWNDYQGVFLDIVFEDLLTQKKKPILRAELSEFAGFLMTDLSMTMIQYYLSKMMKK